MGYAQSMTRSAALDTVINAITGEVSSLDLGAALATLGVPAAQQEHVHRAHSEHARPRRREHELGALFASARELAEASRVAAAGSCSSPSPRPSATR